jgi:aspartate carbamoyltransferase
MWHGTSVLGVDQFTKTHLEDVFALAENMKQLVAVQGGCDLLKGKVLGNVFYENSTRTRASFETAAYRLGGNVLNISTTGTSVKKGETLQDTLRCIECYTDVLVLRHPENGSVVRVDEYLKKPLLNAGDGTREHPTQALLDGFTIMSEHGFIDGLTVTMLGDLKHGRTVHSLSKLLCNFSNVTLRFVSPDALQMPAKILTALQGKVTFSQHADINEVIGETDVLYVTRVQKERFATLEEYDAVQGTFVVDRTLMQKAKDNMIVMHPLPRVGEILEEVDNDPRCVYFSQMANGMYTRMALLALALVKP